MPHISMEDPAIFVRPTRGWKGFFGSISRAYELFRRPMPTQKLAENLPTEDGASSHESSKRESALSSRDEMTRLELSLLGYSSKRR